MNAANLTIRLDSSLKEEAESLFSDLGMSLSAAFNIFLRQAIRVQGLPFAVTRSVPNARTLKAMREAEEIANDPNAETYETVEDLFKAAEA